MKLTLMTRMADVNIMDAQGDKLIPIEGAINIPPGTLPAAAHEIISNAMITIIDNPSIGENKKQSLLLGLEYILMSEVLPKYLVVDDKPLDIEFEIGGK